MEASLAVQPQLSLPRIDSAKEVPRPRMIAFVLVHLALLLHSALSSSCSDPDDPMMFMASALFHFLYKVTNRVVLEKLVWRRAEKKM